jgi:hypothetical protein
MRQVVEESSDKDRTGPKARRENVQKRRGPKRIHRSRDHVIGVRISASQPTCTQSAQFLNVSEHSDSLNDG